ncbi:bifunctional adenosylcobinamide kinase/adenosylcobinamide-phosphate guanylyltransferase [Brevibacillus marinus]|uniref:bifunctional adenosylcobinamide kinase/adenosylcobinamide-phosphate guanylyltransferase n=1 Tax=Brevibacillus marinus TaxID=2496837 RepID=UPI0013DFD4BE|nr:bifunctional adenosylcobinamide kinase/adenosylcobinamide-phosphate guanylyltransferase [Brevibacillus marinus]
MSIVLVMGGVRSGKSAYAEQLAQQRGRDSVLYVATGLAVDREMELRIKQHQRRRPRQWQTCEEATALPAVFAAYPGSRVVLVDSFSGWIANLLLAHPEQEGSEPQVQQMIRERVAELLAYCRQQPEQCWILISDEVGWGGVAPTPLGRLFQDALGLANQAAAAAADEAYFVVAGQPLSLKGGGARWPG